MNGLEKQHTDINGVQGERDARAQLQAKLNAHGLRASRCDTGTDAAGDTDTRIAELRRALILASNNHASEIQAAWQEIDGCRAALEHERRRAGVAEADAADSVACRRPAQVRASARSEAYTEIDKSMPQT